MKACQISVTFIHANKKQRKFLYSKKTRLVKTKFLQVLFFILQTATHKMLHIFQEELFPASVRAFVL